MRTTSVKYLVTCALFVAVSFVLANIKIMGTVAFDSLPAFIGAMLVSNVFGGIVAAVGHLFSAVLSGFPFGLPVHLITAGVMFLAAYIFGLSFRILRKRFGFVPALIVSTILGTLINGPVAVLALSPLLLPIMGKEGLIAFTGILSLAAIANILAAHAICPFLEKAGLSAAQSNGNGEEA